MRRRRTARRRRHQRTSRRRQQRNRRTRRRMHGGEYVNHVYYFSVVLHGFEENNEGGAWNFNIDDRLNIENNVPAILENLRQNIEIQKAEGYFNDFKQIEFEHVQGNKFRLSAEVDNDWDENTRKEKYGELLDSYETSEFNIRPSEDEDPHTEYLQVKGHIIDDE